jgi:hypothetical protein
MFLEHQAELSKPMHLLISRHVENEPMRFISKAHLAP